MEWKNEEGKRGAAAARTERMPAKAGGWKKPASAARDGRGAWKTARGPMKEDPAPFPPGSRSSLGNGLVLLARRPALLFLSLAALFAVLFAQAGLPDVPGGSLFNATGGAYGELVRVLTLGLAAAAFASSVIFMAAQAFRQGEWEMQAKTEIYQVLAAAIWGLVIFSAVSSVDKITSAWAGGTLFDFSHAYLSQVACLSASTSLQMEGYKIGLQFFAGMKSRYYAGPWGFSFPTYAGFEVIERGVDLIQMFIIPFTSSIYAQMIGLDIIHASAMAFILPAGVLLRLFPPTRDAGGFLMATAFALYFILPFTYVIHKQVMEPMYAQEFGHGMCVSEATSTPGSAEPGNVFLDMATRLRPDQVAKDLFKFPTQISYIAVQAVFLPALSMILVVTFIRTATKFFSRGME